MKMISTVHLISTSTVFETGGLSNAADQQQRDGDNNQRRRQVEHRVHGASGPIRTPWCPTALSAQAAREAHIAHEAHEVSRPADRRRWPY
jgi:hypothetical protein